MRSTFNRNVQVQYTGDADYVACDQSRDVQRHKDSVGHLASDCNASQTDSKDHGDCHGIDRAAISISETILNMQSKTYMSQPRRTCEIQELHGRPPSRANDLGSLLVEMTANRSKYDPVWVYQSCLDVVVTPLTEHDTTRMRITTTRTFAAATECVALSTTAMYGWPVGESRTDSRSPRQNINVTG